MYEAISDVLFKRSVGRFKQPGNIGLVMYTAASYLPRKTWPLQKGFFQWGY